MTIEFTSDPPSEAWVRELESARLAIRLARLVTLRGFIYSHIGPGNGRRMTERYDAVAQEVQAAKVLVSPRWWPKEERLNRLLDLLDDTYYRRARDIPLDVARLDLIDSRFNTTEEVLHTLWDEQDRRNWA
jgi:hypothetical protein